MKRGATSVGAASIARRSSVSASTCRSSQTASTARLLCSRAAACAGAPPAAAVAAAAVASSGAARTTSSSQSAASARHAASAGALGAARDEQRVELRRVVDAVLVRKHREDQLLEQRGDNAARRIGGAEGGECGACGTESSSPLSAASAAPRASPPARSAARASTYSAPSALSAAKASPSRPPAAATAPPSSPSRQHARSGVGTSAGAAAMCSRRNFATLYAASGWRAPSYSTARLCRLSAPRRPWASPPRASACRRPPPLGLRIRRARDAEAGVQRGAAGHRSHAREHRRRRLAPVGARAAVGDGRAHQRRRRRRRRRRLAHLLRRLADRRGVGVGVGDAGEVPRGLLRRPPRAFEQVATRPAAAPSPSLPSSGVRGARGVQPGERLDERRAGGRSARRGGTGCGGAAEAATAWAWARRSAATRASGQPRIVGSALGCASVVAAGWQTRAASVPQRSAAPRVVRRARCRHCLEQRAHRARSGRRPPRRRCRARAWRRVRAARARRRRGPSWHEALRLVRAEQPQGDRAGAERDAQLRRCPRARRGRRRRRRRVAQTLAGLRRAPGGRAPAEVASSGAVARCSSYRSRPRTSAVQRARLLPREAGAPGSDRSWRSAPRACLACSSASAHRPRADAAARQCARSACQPEAVTDVGGGRRARR